MTRSRSIGILGLLVAVSLGAQSRSSKAPYSTWSDYGGSSDSMHYSALNQITRSNVANSSSRGISSRRPTSAQ